LIPFDWKKTQCAEDERSDGFFSYVPLERRIPADHPLRAIRTLTDEALAGLSRDFNKLYARDGRPSIPPRVVLALFAMKVALGIASAMHVTQLGLLAGTLAEEPGVRVGGRRMLLDHVESGLAFRRAVGLGHPRIDDEPVAVLRH
jgi:hypothetical protein